MSRRQLDVYRHLEEAVADKRQKVSAARNALEAAISEHDRAVAALSGFAFNLTFSAPPEEPNGTPTERQEEP